MGLSLLHVVATLLLAVFGLKVPTGEAMIAQGTDHDGTRGQSTVFLAIIRVQLYSTVAKCSDYHYAYPSIAHLLLHHLRLHLLLLHHLQ